MLWPLAPELAIFSSQCLYDVRYHGTMTAMNNTYRDIHLLFNRRRSKYVVSNSRHSVYWTRQFLLNRMQPTGATFIRRELFLLQ